MNSQSLLLGIDGGGTRCRARLATLDGGVIGEACTGPANLGLGLGRSFAAVTEAATQCLQQAGLTAEHFATITACLALAGASEPTYLAAAQAYTHPFAATVVTTDAHAACVGAHRDRDGGIVVVGTGSVGWAVLKGQSYRVGGWGLPVSDEGSGAWIGSEALRRVLWARDGRVAWTPLLRALFAEFKNDPHAIVRFAQSASPGDFGTFAPRIVEFAARDDPTACELMKAAACHIDALADQLLAIGADRLALAGGLAASITRWIGPETRAHLVPPIGDALDGALYLARLAAQPHAQVA